MKKISVITLLTLFLTGYAMQSSADAYIGLGVGSTAYKVDLSSLGGRSFDDKTTGTKFYGGYAFNKYFALEASYYNFAEASVGALETDPGSGVFVSASANSKGFAGYAVGMYPVSKKVNLMAKLGVLSWTTDLEFNNTTGSNSGTDIAYGLVASYAFTKQILAVAEWEGFNSDNPELSLLSVGFRFNFK